MNAILWNSRIRRVLFAVLWIVMVGLLVHASGLRINPTPSLPKGVYRIASGAPAKGDFVTFCLQGEFAELARERGYLQPVLAKAACARCSNVWPERRAIT